MESSRNFAVNCQVLFLRDESPVEDDTDFKTNPNIHQTIQYDQWSECELKKNQYFLLKIPNFEIVDPPSRCCCRGRSSGSQSAALRISRRTPRAPRPALWGGRGWRSAGKYSSRLEYQDNQTFLPFLAFWRSHLRSRPPAYRTGRRGSKWLERAGPVLRIQSARLGYGLGWRSPEIRYWSD